MATRTVIDYYEVLGVSARATATEIKDAYRKLALAYHPDRNQGATPEVRRIAEERLKLLNEAYEQLGDSGRRARYDRMRPTSSSAGSTWQDADARAHTTNRQGHHEQARQEQRTADEQARAQRVATLRAEYADLIRQRTTIIDRYSGPLSEARRDDQVADTRWRQEVKAGQSESRLRRRGALGAWLVGAAGAFAALIAIAQGLAALDLTRSAPPPLLTYMLFGLATVTWLSVGLIRACGEARRLPRALMTAFLYMPVGVLIYVVGFSLIVLLNPTDTPRAMITLLAVVHGLTTGLALIGAGWYWPAPAPRPRAADIARERDREMAAWDRQMGGRVSALQAEARKLGATL